MAKNKKCFAFKQTIVSSDFSRENFYKRSMNEMYRNILL